MELALAKYFQDERPKISVANPVTQLEYAIRHFEDTLVPFRAHWKSLINKLPLSDSPNVMKIIPFLFRFEMKNEHQNIGSNIRRASEITKEFLNKYFPLSRNDKNFIAVQVGDEYNTIPALQSFHVFQESLKTNNPKAIPVHYNSELLPSPANILNCKNLLFFQGAITTNLLRKKIKDIFGKKKDCLINDTNNFFYWQENTIELKKTYEEGMVNSKYVLCPKGWATNSIRFYETMSVGRIPVLISDDTQLPLGNLIPYEKFIIRVPEYDVCNILDYLKLSNEELIYRSNLIKETYDKFFCKENFINFIKLSLQNKQKKLQIHTQSTTQKNKKHSALIVTNACNSNCGGCHQLCGHWGDNIWFINENDFVLGIECLIEHYKLRRTPRHHINVYGGEPTIHPNWDRLLDILYSYQDYPFIVFTNGKTMNTFPQTGFKKFEKIFEQFAGHNKNVAYRLDKKEYKYFAPTLIAPCDVLKQAVDYWALAQNNCCMWATCEMVIYKNKAYICAPAAAMDNMFYNGQYGWVIERNKPPFEKNEDEIRDQAEHFCYRCRFCFRDKKIPKQLVTDKTLATFTNYNAITNKSNLRLIANLEIHRNKQILFI